MTLRHYYTSKYDPYYKPRHKPPPKVEVPPEPHREYFMVDYYHDYIFWKENDRDDIVYVNTNTLDRLNITHGFTDIHAKLKVPTVEWALNLQPTIMDYKRHMKGIILQLIRDN